MNGLMLLMALTTPGVEYGWQTTAQGLEYIVQIEPPVVQSLIEGREVYSLVPRDITRIDQVRLHQGEGQLNKEDVASTRSLQEVEYGYQPLAGGGMDFIIQILPAGVRGFQMGTDVILPVPQQLNQVRRITIRVGNGSLPQVAPAGQNQPPATNPRGNPQEDPAPAPPPSVITLPPRPATDPMNPNNPNTNPNTNPNQPNPNPYGQYDPNRGNPNYNTGGATGTNNTNPYGIPPYSNPYGQPPNGQPGAGQPPAQPNYPPNYANYPPYGQTNPYAEPPRGSTQPPYYGPQPQPQPQPQPAPQPPVVAAAPVPDPAPTAAPAPAAAPVSTTSARPSDVGYPSRSADAAPDEHPWLPMMVTSLALIASLGANLFLGWIAMGLYDRYRRALTDMREHSRRVARA